MSGGLLDRRGLLKAAGTAGLVAATGGAIARPAAASAGAGAAAAAAVPFDGDHQAGILTLQQRHLVFAALDLAAPSQADLRDLLRAWSAAARRLTAGVALTGDADGNALAPPADTGEAGGLAPARLTLTFGLGATALSAATGLAARRPAQLAPLPRFAGDALEPARSGGDLCIQACSDDPQVAFHAVRNLIREARGTASPCWLQTGFLRPSEADTSTPRNLMGFRDGTANLDARDAGRMRDAVWAAARDGQPWMAGGSYLVARRVRIRVEAWDRTTLEEQELFVGRHKASGAPIGARRELDRVDSARLDPGSHVRLANPRTGPASEAERMLRRGYNFSDGLDALGQLDAGLFFLAFQRDPRRQFVPVQQRLAAADKLGEYLVHTGSAVFAVPPGARRGGWVGETLFA